RVDTRVVFLDALVKDKKTKSAVNDLKPENFEVLADGRRRDVTYFAREGDQGRKPLALVLIFDLQRHGAGRYMRRADILAAMAAELTKLRPEDEVAVVVLNAAGANNDREWLVRLTRQRAQVTTALSTIPTLVADDSEKSRDSREAEPEVLTTDTLDPAKPEAERQEPARRGEPAAAEEVEDEVEEFVDSKGQRATRMMKPDGTLLVRRLNKDGSETIDNTGASELPVVTRDIARLLAKERPNSQGALVYITDGIVPIFYAERDYVESKLTRSNLIFNALVTDMKFGFRLLMPIAKPIGNWVGLSIAGSAQRLAKQSGGESLRVRRPADYASGLQKIIGNLNARYSLGFALAESETNDGRLHSLEVRVRGARDAKGKERKLEVKSRAGYFMPQKKGEEAKRDNAAGENR
ncbi:MAG: hypothetical protein ACRD9R_03155, partial [Pyrinomonadaceae bacterium]